MVVACLSQTLHTSPQIFFLLTRKRSVFKSLEDKKFRDTRNKAIIEEVTRNIVNVVMFNFLFLNKSLLNLCYIILQRSLKERRQRGSSEGHGLCRSLLVERSTKNVIKHYLILMHCCTRSMNWRRNSWNKYEAPSCKCN
ncbi:hypothetical protein NC651_006968 [Populus alba x Populus x berolinensis]|nr:hypothetical protein NC651_006968 [Populus alba x Populus x berolinensis]